MDWIRRNWPDLLIGAALIAVIAMIVATLLSGGSLLSLVRRDAPPPEATLAETPRAEPQPAPGEGGEGSGEADTLGGAEPTDPPRTDVGPDPFIPDVPPPQTGGSGAPERATPGTGQRTERPSQPASGQPQAATPGGISYRVSAGALDTRARAETLAETYRVQGLPVSIAEEGDLFIVWVGPYRTEAEANRAAQRIRSEGGEALVYTLPATGAASAGAGQSNTEAITEEVTPPTPGSVTEGAEAVATPVEAPTAPAGERFLQVGAFANLESAQPRREQLEALDFTVRSSRTASGLVRLFVGPFDDAELSEAQALLDAQGIENFPVQ